MWLNNIFISTYTFILNGVRTNNAGPVSPLLNFFKYKAKRIYLLEQPLPGSDFIDTQLTLIVDGNTVGKFKKEFFFFDIDPKKFDTTKTYISLKLRDIISNIYFFAKNFNKIKKDKIDIYIGVECINAIFGILLKKIGYVDKTIYYVFDWAPNRYINPLMNGLYIWLDKIATYYSDYTWNITYTIGEARRDVLKYNVNRMSPQIYVPYCVNFDDSKILSDEEIDTNLIVYSGGLIKENGADLLLIAYRIVMKQFPDTRLLIIGGGYGIEQDMKKYVVEHSMQKNVVFTGYIAEENKIIDLQCRGAIGVAPYPFIKGSRKPYGDVIKVRMYFACGLVTITTPVPPVSREIYEEQLGFRTKDDSPEEIAKGMCLFLGNKELLFLYRKNVINKAKLSSWENNYTNAFSQMYKKTCLNNSILHNSKQS